MKRNGFTLIELLIYIAITAVVVVALTNLMIAVFATQKKAETSTELQQNLRFAMDRIVERVRQAQRIDALGSTFDSDVSTLSLFMPDPLQSPTVFSRPDGRIWMQGGRAKERMALTSKQIVIDSLRFSRKKNVRGRDLVRISIHGFDSARTGTGVTADSMLIETSAALRRP